MNEFMQQEIASSLGIDFHFGVPQSELSRCADLVQMPRRVDARAIQSTNIDDPWNSMRHFIYNNPPLFPLGINSDAWRMSEFPSTSPQSNARSVAKLMSTLATIVHTRQDGLLNYDLLNQAVQIFGDGEDLNLMRHPGSDLDSRSLSRTTSWCESRKLRALRKWRRRRIRGPNSSSRVYLYNESSWTCLA